MCKETEQFMLAQFKDVLEMYQTFTTMEQVQEYTEQQLKNVKSQIKEPSATDDQSESR